MVGRILHLDELLEQGLLSSAFVALLYAEPKQFVNDSIQPLVCGCNLPGKSLRLVQVG
jgi:hypothetical protein